MLNAIFPFLGAYCGLSSKTGCRDVSDRGVDSVQVVLRRRDFGWLHSLEWQGRHGEKRIPT